MNFSDLYKIDAKNNFEVDQGDYSIPTLDDLLKRYNKISNLHLELKSRDQDLSEIVLESLESNGWLGSKKGIYEIGGITISSFFIEQLIRFRKFNKEERTAWLLEKISDIDLEICLEQKIDLICPRAKFSDKISVEKAQNKGILVRNWGVSSSEDLIMSYNSNSTGTTCDWPLRGKEIIKNYENN